MPYDTPLADAVPTRRSSRMNGVSATPQTAEIQAAEIATPTAEVRALSRRESRAAAGAPAVIPATVWASQTGVTAAVEPAVARLRTRTRAVVAETEPVTEAAAPEVVVELTAERIEAPEIVVTAEPVVVPEPEAAAQTEAAPQTAAESEASEVPLDDFEAAARLFAFTGETPTVQLAQPEQAAPAFAAPTPSRRRKLATTAFSFSVMSIVALMTVSVTAPAEALAAASDTTAVTVMAPAADVEVIKADEIQAFVAPAEGATVELDRDQSYALTTFEQIARESGIKMTSLFVNDPNSPIQWPFAVGVGMSYGFGMRSGGMHEGIDFTPGAGAQVQAIAEGTVRVASESGGAYGVHVYIDHEIDGQMISSHYAHMQYGSLQVVEGQKVKAGDPVGKTGNTGRSYGAHTHFELRVNGTDAIDPLPWLQKHAGGWQG